MKKVHVGIIGMTLLLVVGIGCGKVTGNATSGSGETAPLFSANTLDGSTVNLGDYIGKEPLLLVFFATWCPPCRREVPELINYQDEYASRGLSLVAISVDDAVRPVAAFVKEQLVNYTVLHDATGEGARLYKVMGIPTNILINRDGVIVFREHRIPDAKEIESILN